VHGHGGDPRSPGRGIPGGLHGIRGPWGARRRTFAQGHGTAVPRGSQRSAGRCGHGGRHCRFGHGILGSWARRDHRPHGR
ncbi:unnamed protein product, partial [Symbiodinium sp. CCMP2456]